MKANTLSAEQSKYLGSVLGEIARGEDANKAFSISFGRGESKAKAIARGNISLVMHWIASAIAPVDGDPPGYGLSVAAACALAVPIAQGCRNGACACGERQGRSRVPQR